MNKIHAISLVVIGFCLSGCLSSGGTQSNLKSIYDQSAQYHEPDRNPIIVIPGILGSRLVDESSGVTVWGAFRSEYADPRTPEGTQLIALPIDGGDESSLTSSSNVKPDGVLESLELQLAGIPIKIQAYAGILQTLGAGGYQDQTLGLSAIDYGNDHFTCFQFDYDWRKDIPENAAALKVFIDQKRLEVQQTYEKRYGIKNADVKFDIAAHSMGGLLTRYFMRYGDSDLPLDGSVPPVTWKGGEDVERVILVAPPNAGSLEALDQLLNGFNTGRPLLPFYEPALLGTFPSIYQMLPRERHKAVVFDEDLNKPVDNLLSPEVWAKFGWGLSAIDEDAQEVRRRLLPNISADEERVKIASKYQANALRRAKQFHAALDQNAPRPKSIDYFLVAGDADETPSIGSIKSDTGEFDFWKYGNGDSVVLRSSALMDERVGQEWSPTLKSPINWTSVIFVFSEHRKITSEPVFEDNVLYWLLEDPRG